MVYISIKIELIVLNASTSYRVSFRYEVVYVIFLWRGVLGSNFAQIEHSIQTGRRYLLVSVFIVHSGNLFWVRKRIHSVKTLIRAARPIIL